VDKRVGRWCGQEVRGCTFCSTSCSTSCSTRSSSSSSHSKLGLYLLVALSCILFWALYLLVLSLLVLSLLLLYLLLPLSSSPHLPFYAPLSNSHVGRTCVCVWCMRLDTDRDCERDSGRETPRASERAREKEKERKSERERKGERV
jgi:hypothetical protein